jgi:nitroreductase
MMDFLTLAKERYSVRKFSTKPIEKDKLDQVLQAGRLAPTASNLQPQRILVINSKTALAKLKECTPYHFNAPAAMLVCYDKTACWQRNFDGKSSGDVDVSIVTTHMMLEAADIGLGSTWVMYFQPEKMKEIYNLPDSFVPVALLVIGYPADDATPSIVHAERITIDNTVFYNDYSEGEARAND